MPRKSGGVSFWAARAIRCRAFSLKAVSKNAGAEYSKATVSILLFSLWSNSSFFNELQVILKRMTMILSCMKLSEKIHRATEPLCSQDARQRAPTLMARRSDRCWSMRSINYFRKYVPLRPLPPLPLPDPPCSHTSPY